MHTHAHKPCQACTKCLKKFRVTAAGVFRTQSSYTHTVTGPVLSTPFYRWGHRWLLCETDQGFNPGLAGSKACHHDTICRHIQPTGSFKTGFKFLNFIFIWKPVFQRLGFPICKLDTHSWYQIDPEGWQEARVKVHMLCKQ